VRDVAILHYLQLIDSIKPSLQFSHTFGVFLASRGLYFNDVRERNHYTHEQRKTYLKEENIVIHLNKQQQLLIETGICQF
jgi:hypothetical protein